MKCKCRIIHIVYIQAFCGVCLSIPCGTVPQWRSVYCVDSLHSKCSKRRPIYVVIHIVTCHTVTKDGFHIGNWVY
jgi:hypothetical protein